MVYKYLLCFLFLWIAVDADTVQINPGDDISSIVDANPAGTTYLIAAGVYENVTITPKANDVYLGDDGAIFSGAMELTNWTYDAGSNMYSHSGFTVAGQISSGGPKCQTNVLCTPPEHLLIDDVFSLPMNSLAAVTTVGQYFIDTTTHTIYMMDDPSGKVVEITVTPFAFTSGSSSTTNVTIKNLIIEKYASPIGTGAVGGSSPRAGWVVEDCEIRYCHGFGLAQGADSVTVRNYIHHNGQYGMKATGTNFIIEYNEFGYNGLGGFQLSPSGTQLNGGIQVFSGVGSIINNYLHNSGGDGVVITSSLNMGGQTIIERNLAVSSGRSGIFAQYSSNIVIRNNVVLDSGVLFNSWLWSGGITLRTAQLCDVYNNLVDEVSTTYGNGLTLLWQTGSADDNATNNAFHDNHVIMRRSGAVTGAITDKSFPINDKSTNITFNFDHYHVPDITGKFFEWDQVATTITGMRSSTWAQEVNGTIDTNLTYTDEDPVVTITSPAPDSTVDIRNPSFTVSVDAVDDIGIHNVELLINGQPFDTTYTFPYSFSVPTGSYSGAGTLTVSVLDISRHQTNTTISVLFAAITTTGTTGTTGAVPTMATAPSAPTSPATTPSSPTSPSAAPSAYTDAGTVTNDNSTTPTSDTITSTPTTPSSATGPTVDNIKSGSDSLLVSVYAVIVALVVCLL